MIPCYFSEVPRLFTAGAIRSLDSWSKKRRHDGTPVGPYAMGYCHGLLSRRCRRATDTRRDTGPWRCSSDGTDDETRLIVRRYVVRGVG